MKTVKPNPVIKAITEFYQLLQEYADYGADDSEPRHFFVYLLEKSLKGDDFPEVNPEDWQLYSTVDTDQEVADELTAKAKQLHDLITESKYFHVVEAAERFGLET
jgi:hypothetical protein